MSTTNKRMIDPKESVWLQGPRSRGFEILFLFRIVREFFKGFRAMHFIGPSVAIFGSARFKEDHPYYQLGRTMGAKIVEQTGLTVLTGGGPGVMEAGNRGAKDAGGNSIGINILLPHEQSANPYVDKFVTIKYFFVRKVLLVKYSYAFIILPGGFGTMDEFFETLTLIQTKKIHHFPVVVMGMDYYGPLKDYIGFMVEQKTISPEDLDLLLFTDSPDEAIAHIEKYIKSNYKVEKRAKPLWWLFERK